MPNVLTGKRGLISAEHRWQKNRPDRGRASAISKQTSPFGWDGWQRGTIYPHICKGSTIGNNWQNYDDFKIKLQGKCSCLLSKTMKLLYMIIHSYYILFKLWLDVAFNFARLFIMLLSAQGFCNLYNKFFSTLTSKTSKKKKKKNKRKKKKKKKTSKSGRKICRWYGDKQH